MRFLNAAGLLLGAVTCIALGGGCAADDPGPTAPQATAKATPSWVISSTPLPEKDESRAAPGRMIYPLELGNAWEYRAHLRIEATDGGDVEPPEEVIRTTRASIIGSIEFDGLCYAIEERAITEDIRPGETLERIHYREDRNGLYEVELVPVGRQTRSLAPDEFGDGGRFDRYLRTLDRHGNWVAAGQRLRERIRHVRELGRRHRPGGPLDYELVRLDYPLHRHKSWIVRDDPFLMTSTVEGREVLHLPVGHTPAWRVRIESTLFGPDDEVHMFWGRDGYLGWRVLAYTDVVDDDGRVVGRLRLTDEEYLQALDLHRGGELACPVPASTSGVGAR